MSSLFKLFKSPQIQEAPLKLEEDAPLKLEESPQIKNAEGIYTNLFDTEFIKKIEELTTQYKETLKTRFYEQEKEEELKQENDYRSYFPNFVKITNEDIDTNCDNTTTFKFVESYYNAIFNICGFSIQNNYRILMHINIKRGEELKKDKLEINLLYLDNYSTVYCAIFANRFIRRNIDISEKDIAEVEDKQIDNMVKINIKNTNLDNLKDLYDFLIDNYKRYNKTDKQHPFLRNSFLTRYLFKKKKVVTFEKFKERIERNNYFRTGGTKLKSRRKSHKKKTRRHRRKSVRHNRHS